jgi:homoserine O-acetyltransferase
MIGPGKPFDTERFCVRCSNVIGGCGGSTGPAATQPGTGRPYGLRFPVVTISDMVAAQAILADALGIKQFYAIAGGCMGGFQVLEWMAGHPGRLRNAICISATPRTSAHCIALWQVMRDAVRLDPNFREGDYYDGEPPAAGLALGTRFGMLIRMSRETMERRFGLRLLHEEPRYRLDQEFEVEAFLQRIRGGAFDANSLLYLTRAMDYFDLTRGGLTVESLFSCAPFRTLLVSYRSDWRYPPEGVDEIRAALAHNKAAVEHHVLDSEFGHGAFVYDHRELAGLIRSFLA